MFVITGKKNGVIWDVKGDKPLIKFIKGKAETENEDIAVKLQDMGYKVKGKFSGKNKNNETIESLETKEEITEAPAEE